MGGNKGYFTEAAVTDAIESTLMNDLQRANSLMVEALAILDACRHQAAPHLDLAIVHLGLRPDGEGMPPGMALD